MEKFDKIWQELDTKKAISAGLERQMLHEKDTAKRGACGMQLDEIDRETRKFVDDLLCQLIEVDAAAGSSIGTGHVLPRHVLESLCLLRSNEGEHDPTAGAEAIISMLELLTAGSAKLYLKRLEYKADRAKDTEDPELKTRRMYRSGFSKKIPHRSHTNSAPEEGWIVGRFEDTGPAGETGRSPWKSGRGD